MMNMSLRERLAKDKEQMKIIAIIEARMGSSRLPQKTLADIAGKTLLERVIERIRPAKSVDDVIVATSVSTQDNAIAELCRRNAIACFRGSERDVLGRVYDAAKEYRADIIVQCGADCPFYDAQLIDMLTYILAWGGYSYVANDMRLTFSEGVDAHVIRFDALEEAAKEAKDPRERDDTPRFIWNHPERFSIFNLEALPGSFYNRPEIRLTVDYREDLELTRKIYEGLYKNMPQFSTRQLIAFLDQHPELRKINRNCEQKSGAYIK